MEQKFYAEDLCALKADSSKKGLVDRTHSDVTTHHPMPASSYPHGILNHAKVSSNIFREFLISGVPPRGCIVVTWTPLSWRDSPDSVLIEESALELLDRSLLVGDIVKRNPRDATSGTVVDIAITASLIPPKEWPVPSSRAYLDEESTFGNFTPNPSKYLHSIPAAELKSPTDWEEYSFIIYHNWIGRIAETTSAVSIRLGDNSIVEVEDSLELYSSGQLVVGDYVTTKKGNLRRGIWKYGAFDANVQPAGYVADLRITSVDVDWLCRRYSPAEAASSWPEPPWTLERDILESGEVYVYVSDFQSDSAHTGLPNRSFGEGICVGDRVRFRDLEDAGRKYGQLSRVPRTASLGYDINVFLVAATHTKITVLWQDLTTSIHDSTDVVPSLDLDDEDELWPGEIITTRTAKQHDQPASSTKSPDEAIFQPLKVGVVQTVDAKNRIAQVRWFPDATVLLSGEDKNILLSGSSTGQLAENVEDVSLYEVWSIPALNKRLGDFVMILPPTNDAAACNRDTESERSNDMDRRSLDWFGQVVQLGLDGLFTIYLGASATPSTTRVPVERIVMVYSTDFDTSEFGSIGGSDTEELEESLSDAFYYADTDDLAAKVSIEYEGGEPLDDNDAEDSWSTESEADEDFDTPMTDADVVEDQIAKEETDSISLSVEPQDLRTDTEPNQTSGSTTHGLVQSSSQFDLDRFAVLEGPAPADHHFHDHEGTETLNGQRLRRIHKEYKILASSLPEGVYARTWDSRLDLLRVLMVGPCGTPYEFAPFVMDFHLNSHFPLDPPLAFFHSWTSRGGPINPNLYEDGKICLSLLGTWSGREQHENWVPSKSTVLQIIVSLLGLVLVEEPYYNEAGYEARAGTAESQLPSALYSERTYFRSRAFIAHAIEHPVSGLEDVVRKLYVGRNPEAPLLLRRAIYTAIDVIRRSSRKSSAGTTNAAFEQGATDKSRRVSTGALVPLRRQVGGLIDILSKHDSAESEVCMQMLHDCANLAEDSDGTKDAVMS